jgi:small subunit ribosomal protein S1
VSEEYREAFGEHAYDEQGNYIGFDYGDAEFTPETEAQAAWADLVEHPDAAIASPPAEVAADHEVSGTAPVSPDAGEAPVGEPVGEQVAEPPAAEPPTVVADAQPESPVVG